VSLSLDGVTFSGVGSFAPTDWPTNVNSYGVDVFSFSSASTRYVRLDLSNCPQPNSEPGGGCGMGEVAVSAVTPAVVSEPEILALLGLALAGFAAVRRRTAFA
jgi:hypothetical protein